MNRENVIQRKSYDFALRIIKMYKYLSFVKKENVISKQILRSGTSIGANIEEAIGGQGRKDFYAKLNIAYKEARETRYWLKLLKDSEMLTENQANSIMSDCEEICAIIGKIKFTILSKNDN